MNARPQLGLVLLACAFAPVWAAQQAPKPPTTVGDLPQRPIDINTSAKVSGSPAKAMESYRHFLEMQNADPKLRAEAMRRLADLNLESGELERMVNEVTQLDLPGAEAIKLYTTLLKGYPDYARNDQVLYQLARAYETTGQPEQALVTLDRIVRQFPRTPQLDEVQFRRGELLYGSARELAPIDYLRTFGGGVGSAVDPDRELGLARVASLGQADRLHAGRHATALRSGASEVRSRRDTGRRARRGRCIAWAVRGYDCWIARRNVAWASSAFNGPSVFAANCCGDMVFLSKTGPPQLSLSSVSISWNLSVTGWLRW